MTKPQLHNILDRLDFWIKESIKLQKAMAELIKVMVPTYFSPIIEDDCIQGFIEGVCIVEPKLKDGLEYYAYELPTMETAEGKIGKKTYNLKNKDEYVQFMLDNNPHR